MYNTVNKKIYDLISRQTTKYNKQDKTTFNSLFMRFFVLLSVYSHTQLFSTLNSLFFVILRNIYVHVYKNFISSYVELKTTCEC